MENLTVFSGSSNELEQDTLRSLILEAQAGSESAFTELYNVYFKKIYRFIFYRVSHREVAEDLTEDVFVKAYGKIRSLGKVAAFEGWLYQIARNRVIDHYREKKATVALEDLENTLEYESSIIDDLNLEDQQKTLLKLIRQLPPDQQKVIKLKFFEELENAEIAALLNKSEGAIRVIQHRGIQHLQQLLKKGSL